MERKYAQAEPLLKDSHTGRKEREKTISLICLPRLTEALECLVQLYEATGHATEAERWRKELAERQGAKRETQERMR